MTRPDDFTLEYRKYPDGSITDFRITRGKALYRLPWWRRLLTPWYVWRFYKPTAPFPTTTNTHDQPQP